MHLITLHRIKPAPAGILSLALVLAFGSVHPANAAPAELTIITHSDLHFGSVVVLGSGSRNISASGAVSDISIIPTGINDTGPARFTVRYDRGNQGQRNLNLVIELVMSQPPTITQEGVTATVSSFVSDLSGAAVISPGQAVTIEMLNCQTRICERSFQVGGRIDLIHHFGGADLTIALPMDATLISVK